ncbi:MAG TPA: hypothetical protein VGL22_02195 [Terracidiphilus sp.]
MTAIEAALTGLIDYAGLFPPAALDMQSAVRNFLAYRAQQHAWMPGRFILDLNQLDNLREAAGDALAEIPLSVIALADADMRAVSERRAEGFRIDSLEIKCAEPLRIARICEGVPDKVKCYFEVPPTQGCTSAVDAIAAVGMRAKLRTGGMTADGFPAARQVAERLHLLHDRGVSFKATAGLHHAVRSEHKLWYAEDSPTAMMHGFMNMLCAAAAIRFGAPAEQAEGILEERDPAAFRVSDQAIGIHGLQWTTEQIRGVREYFLSVGSCSFTEPVQDLEALGWLPART